MHCAIARASLALGVLALLSSAEATTIDTTTNWDGSSFAAPKFFATLVFGEPDFATIGQTFTVGSDNILDRFTFWLDDVGSPNEIVHFAAFVMEWDGTKATGPILFQSAAEMTTDPTGRLMEPFTFETGGLELVPGEQYVAFLNTSLLFDGIADAGRIGSPNADVYNGGEFVVLMNGADFSKLTTFAWDKVNFDPAGNFTPGLDAAFQAEFSAPVPLETIPPVITVSASRATLWPPNGKSVTVTVSGTIMDELGGSGVQENSATYWVMDEYGQIQPSGSVSLKANGQYAFTVALQASRRGNDQDGRQYMIAVSATDNAGNRGVASAIVTVPHDQGQRAASGVPSTWDAMVALASSRGMLLGRW